MSDLIDRQDAIRIASGYCHPANIVKELERLPSAEPRKKGHWIYDHEYAEAVSHKCSECGKLFTTAIGQMANYCWNCGADMREGE